MKIYLSFLITLAHYLLRRPPNTLYNLRKICRHAIYRRLFFPAIFLHWCEHYEKNKAVYQSKESIIPSSFSSSSISQEKISPGIEKREKNSKNVLYQVHVTCVMYRIPFIPHVLRIFK